MLNKVGREIPEEILEATGKEVFQGIYYKDNTYDAYCSEKYEIDPYNDSWYFYNSEKNGEITLECKFDYSQGREKVPDSLTDKKYGKRYVTSISGSCGIKEFDLNPKNKYMKLVDK